MNRRLLAFFGLPLAAQVAQPPFRNFDQLATEGVVLPPKSWRKPANGECPVCGAMAERFLLPRGGAELPERLWNLPSPAYRKKENDIVNIVTTPLNKRLIDCSHCRNAFWQDAEVSR